MKLLLQDLVLRLDEQNELIQLLAPRRNGSPGELELFYEISKSNLSEVESIEEELGRAILAFLSVRYNGNAFGLSRYREAGKSFAESLEQNANSLLTSGDAEYEFEGAMLRIRRFNDDWSESDIDDITLLMERASSRGSRAAAQYLINEWPAHQAILRKRIQRRLKSK